MYLPGMAISFMVPVILWSWELLCVWLLQTSEVQQEAIWKISQVKPVLIQEGTGGKCVKAFWVKSVQCQQLTGGGFLAWRNFFVQDMTWRCGVRIRVRWTHLSSPLWPASPPPSSSGGSRPPPYSGASLGNCTRRWFVYTLVKSITICIYFFE